METAPRNQQKFWAAAIPSAQRFIAQGGWVIASKAYAYVSADALPFAKHDIKLKKRRVWMKLTALLRITTNGY